MVFTRSNALAQALDIAGSLLQSETYTLAEEPLGFGAPLTGQTGATASITTFGGGSLTITGLSGMTTASPGNFITISGAASSGNNGTFIITGFISSSSVSVANVSGVGSDANSGSITWAERNPYTLEDDLNYVRSDRAAIKGTNFYSSVPTYQRPTAVGTNVPANLSNIAGKTTDARSFVINRKFPFVSVAVSDGYVQLSDTGNMKHADATNRSGIPINDGADSGNDEATYVEIIDPVTGTGLEVLSDNTKRIFGRTRAGTTSTSPNSVEVEFRQVVKGAALSTSTTYTWEAGQPASIDLYYGFRDRLDIIPDTAFRTIMTNGIVGDAGIQQDINDVRVVIGIGDNDTDLSAFLTNTSNFFVFSDLPDGTPSVVEALNTINAQIGDRNFTGPTLTDGYTITQSLQALSNAISSSSSMVRTVERVSSLIPAGTAHTLPGAQSYTVDGSNNGQNMLVYVRGTLRDPGPISGLNDYEETSSTSVTFYQSIKAGDRINYLIYA